ncbi:glycosyltransferase family 2 protein [Methylocapsa acidiphila]|uniref:glycosyltransferase family 2 protein n=1 Tax=Methylocapsa acidiphila TaxID=133552 RepID=UPI0004128625|nr:glycosyltransferase family 2 protein [Methylocapsa acidiphila]
MFYFDFLQLACETSLTVSVLGLLFVGGGFLSLLGVNLFERATGKTLGRPLRALAIAEADLPHVLVQIPVFNEAEMVADALRSVAELDWPRDRLHIQLLDDSCDETSAIASGIIGGLRAQGYDVLHLRRGDRTGYKAGALAAGMLHSNAPYIAILDVDFRPPANWLRSVVPALIADPEASFVQSRCEFSNYRTNLLTRAQGLMLDAHFVMEQATRFRAGWLFQFNGTGAVWRRAAIDAAGGWSADSLCEDLDLTVRAEIAGWRGLFAMEPPVPGLVPDKVAHWRVQQRRWSNGFVQVARKLLKQVWLTDWALQRKLSATLLILVQTFYPCVAIASAALLGCALLRGGDLTAYRPVISVIAALIAIVGVGMTLAPYVLLRRGSVLTYLATLASLTPLMIFVSLSNAPSILKTVFGATETWKRTPKTRPLPVAPRDQIGRS